MFVPVQLHRSSFQFKRPAMDSSRARAPQRQRQLWLLLLVLSVLLCGAWGARVMQIPREEEEEEVVVVVAKDQEQEAHANEKYSISQCIKQVPERINPDCNSLKPSGVKVETYTTPAITFRPGDVKDKYFHMQAAPKGHIGLRRVTAQMVDEYGVAVPHHQFHFHHWFGFQYAVPKSLHSPKHTQELIRSLIAEGGKKHYSAITSHLTGTSWSYDLVGRSESKLLTAFGKGAETWHTQTRLPPPFGLEIGAHAPEAAHEIVWIVNVHGIDTRGVVDRNGCIECRCDLYNATTNERGYLGGLNCCGDETHCVVKEDFNAPERTLYMKISWEYVDWDECVVPIETFYIDITNKDGFGENLVEFTVQGCDNVDPNSEECIHTQDATIIAPIGGQVVYVASHLHSSVLDSILWGEDGRIICHPSPIYGHGTKDGDENKDVIVVMPCYPSMGSPGGKITQGEQLHYQVKYSKIGGPHTGVMGLMTLNIATNEASTTI